VPAAIRCHIVEPEPAARAADCSHDVGVHCACVPRIDWRHLQHQCVVHRPAQRIWHGDGFRFFRRRINASAVQRRLLDLMQR